MPKGDNKVTINFTTEMKQFGDSKKGDLYLSFFTALAFLERYKDEFIAKYGQECYEEHIKRYSIPAVEVRNNSAKRKKESIEQKRRELDLREKELGVRAKFLQAETVRMNDKHEDRTTEKLLENPDYKALLREKRDIENFLLRAQKTPNNSAYRKEYVDRANAKLAEIEQKLKAFEEPQTVKPS